MPLKVLLADDNVTAQKMARQILSDAGYEVIAVSNGAAALKKFNEHRPDLLVLDVYMPGYSGLEVCEKIKMRSPRAGVLLTVGKLEMYQPEEGRRVRADGLIVKPFEASDLLAAIGKLAENVPSKAKHASSPILQPAAEPQSADEHETPSNGNGAAPGSPKNSALPQAEAASASAYDDFPVAAPPAIAGGHENGRAITAPMAAAANAAAEAVSKAETNSPVALALAPEPPAPQPPAEKLEVPAESTSHEALVAAFSATPVKYAPEPEISPSQTDEAEDDEWASEAGEAPAETSHAMQTDTGLQGDGVEDEDEEPESYWIAVRVPLAEAGNGSHAGNGSAQTLTLNESAGSGIAEPAEEQKLSGPGAVLIEQWLQGQPEPPAASTVDQKSSAAAEEAEAAADVAGAAVPETASSEVTSAASAGTQAAESCASPVSAAAFETATTEDAAPANSIQASHQSAPAICEAIQPAHVDAAAAEAAREVAGSAANGKSQADEIAQAVERALARFRDTLIEEIARELEKK